MTLCHLFLHIYHHLYGPIEGENNKCFSLEAEGEMKKKNLVWLKLKHIHPGDSSTNQFLSLYQAKHFAKPKANFFSISILSTEFFHFSNKEFVFSFALLQSSVLL